VDLYFHHFRFTHFTSVNFEVKFDNPIQGLQLWLVAEARYHYRCYVDFVFKYNVRVATLI